MIFVLSPMGHGSRLVTKVFSQSRVSEKTVDACHLRAIEVPWLVGDMHLTSFSFTSQCEKFRVTNGQPWPIGDSTNII